MKEGSFGAAARGGGGGGGPGSAAFVPHLPSWVGAVLGLPGAATAAITGYSGCGGGGRRLFERSTLGTIVDETQERSCSAGAAQQTAPGASPPGPLSGAASLTSALRSGIADSTSIVVGGVASAGAWQRGGACSSTNTAAAATGTASGASATPAYGPPMATLPLARAESAPLGHCDLQSLHTSRQADASAHHPALQLQQPAAPPLPPHAVLASCSPVVQQAAGAVPLPLPPAPVPAHVLPEAGVCRSAFGCADAQLQVQSLLCQQSLLTKQPMLSQQPSARLPIEVQAAQVTNQTLQHCQPSSQQPQQASTPGQVQAAGHATTPFQRPTSAAQKAAAAEMGPQLPRASESAAAAVAGSPYSKGSLLRRLFSCTAPAVAV